MDNGCRTCVDVQAYLGAMPNSVERYHRTLGGVVVRGFTQSAEERTAYDRR